MNIVMPTEIFLPATDKVPNNPALPVLIYRDVFDVQIADKHKHFQHAFEQSGWKGVWKNGLYDYHHFHSSSHEALGIASGSAEVQLGGEDGKVIEVNAGDLVVLPAGTGHKRVSASGNLVVIGAYPDGQQDYDICRGKHDAEKNIAEIIAAVPLPTSDPVYGESGPLLKIWVRANAKA